MSNIKSLLIPLNERGEFIKKSMKASRRHVVHDLTKEEICD